MRRCGGGGVSDGCAQGERDEEVEKSFERVGEGGASLREEKGDCDLDDGLVNDVAEAVKIHLNLKRLQKCSAEQPLGGAAVSVTAGVKKTGGGGGQTLRARGRRAQERSERGPAARGCWRRG